MKTALRNLPCLFSFRFLMLFTVAFWFTITEIQSATFNVNSTLDASDASAGDGTCDDGSGNCTLRAAIEEANALGGADIINVPAGTYTLTTSAQLTISSDITLTGAGEGSTFIEAHASPNTATWRVFEVTTNGTDVVFEDMTIRHGSTSSIGGGGILINLGISSTGTAIFTRVTITENRTTGAINGGGLFINDNLTTVNMTGCTIKNNNSGKNAGGFAQGGAVTFNMTDCVVHGNSSISAGGGGTLSEGTNNLTRCIISNNMTSSGQGGGLRLNLGIHNITNCTITNNTSQGVGGGIDDNSGSNSSTLINCTIANNVTTAAQGGGLIFTNSSGQSNMSNCVVADNMAAGLEKDIHFFSGTLNANVTNLVKNCTGTCPTFSYSSDPNLAGPATCGSPLKTYLEPQAPSDAINNGTAPGGNIPSTDICGNSVTSVKDIGSYETTIVLPIEYTFFNSYLENEKSLLHWQTISEVNNEGFEIQWLSRDESLVADKWETLDFVPGAGTSYDKQNYSYLHTSPAEGINYYRLKQLDFDGSYEFSEIVSVAVEENSRMLKVYPNPSENGFFNLYLPESEAEISPIQLLDVTGRLVHKQFAKGDLTNVNVETLPKGLYLLRVKMNGAYLIEKIAIK